VNFVTFLWLNFTLILPHVFTSQHGGVAVGDLERLPDDYEMDFMLSR
jgi:hypothetical protein